MTATNPAPGKPAAPAPFLPANPSNSPNATVSPPGVDSKTDQMLRSCLYDPGERGYEPSKRDRTSALQHRLEAAGGVASATLRRASTTVSGIKSTVSAAVSAAAQKLSKPPPRDLSSSSSTASLEEGYELITKPIEPDESTCKD